MKSVHKSNVYTYAELQELWALSLEDKIAVAQDVMRETFRRAREAIVNRGETLSHEAEN